MDSLPDEIATLKAELALARAKAAHDAATIAQQKLEIAKLKRQLYGPRSARTARLLDQMELELDELEAAATEEQARRRAGCGQDDDGRRLRAQAPRPPAVPRASAARACRGAGDLLATLLFEKFGQHQPLNRQAERYAREGVPLSLSTLRRSGRRRLLMIHRRESMPGSNASAFSAFSAFSALAISETTALSRPC